MSDLVSLLAFPMAFAAIVAILATVAVERLGGRLGGVLVTMPTTIVPASLGMLEGARDPADFRAAMAAVPVGMLVDAAFLYSWRTLPQRLPDTSLGVRLSLMTVLSLGGWLVAAWLMVLGMDAADRAGVPPLVLGGAALLTLVSAGLVALRGAPPSPKGTNRVGPVTLAGRGVLAGLAIGVSVLIASSGHPVAGGMASVFPAIFLTTMVSLWLAQGEAVPIGAVGPMILGSSSVAVYALLAAWCMPLLGGPPGAAATWVGAILFGSVPAAWWLSRRST